MPCIAAPQPARRGASAQSSTQVVPFRILGIDTDNGSEFINEELLAYCTSEQITFTRGRVGNKNDQCFVELCRHPHNTQLSWI
jgi:hypothetical protein